MFSRRTTVTVAERNDMRSTAPGHGSRHLLDYRRSHQRGGDMERLVRDRSFSYIKIPATDPKASAQFYEGAFGWTIRGLDNDRPSFDDASGHVSGSWEIDQAPSREPGVLPFIYVDRIDDAVARIRVHGGEIVEEPYPEGDLWVATFRDPAGNVLGVWHAGDR
jgi:predicted enzyme related to lactoylglutathione lyase